MRNRKILSGAVLAAAMCLSAFAAEKGAQPAPPKFKGSIQVAGTHTEAELAKMAKIPHGQAEIIAREAVKAKATQKTVSDCELEVEGGYLVYSVNIKVTGQKGVEEILVDAGTGRVLAREHEDDHAEGEAEVEAEVEPEGEDH